MLEKIEVKTTNTTDRFETIGRHLFRKGDFDPRTTVTVKEEYSEGREALEEAIPREIPEEDTTDDLSETQEEQVTRRTA